MAREVRITIDDDEVFERMKARKRALDLSWEEVLHRGLRDVPEESAPDSETGATGTQTQRTPGSVPQPSGNASGRRGRQESDPDGVPPANSVGEMVDDIKAQVHQQVRDSLRASMESVDGGGSDLEREVTELERAEDATLGFEAAVGSDRQYRVPLRVRQETSRDGLDVTVVAVRGGKTVADTNDFDSKTRRAVNEYLASRGTATLSFGGEEHYEVAPILEWGHGNDDRPTVTDVEIEEVMLDA